MAKVPAKPKAKLSERPRGGEARSIADLVPSVGGTAFKKFGFVQSSILTRWPEIVGTRLARVIKPSAIKFPRGRKDQGVLMVNVGGAHAVIVQHAIPDLIGRVNSFFGYEAVSSVRIRQGLIAAPPPVRKDGATPAVPPPLAVEPAQAVAPAPANQTLRAIDDPELRAVLDSLAASLARRDAAKKSE